MSRSSSSIAGPTDSQAVMTVDLAALASNWRWLADAAAPAACAAAVKADAYGIGIAEAVPALARAGCRTFFVAHVAEGVRARVALREVGLGDAEARVFALHGFHPATADSVLWAQASLYPVLGSAAELAAWRALAPGQRSGGAALHVDTGMNRLGFPREEAEQLTPDAVAAAGATLLMSHLIAAEEPDNPLNDHQIERFAALRRGPLGALPASLANSAGILLPSRPHYDLVRPGYALYGGNPRPGRPNPMRPVVSVTATILQVRELSAGDTAGYGGLWTARRPTRLAVIGVGYADGYPRNARSLGEAGAPVAMVGGVRCPLAGRVSMDLILIDVTDAPAADARPGAPAALLGPAFTVDDLGASCQTTGYEILTRLGARYSRRYTTSR